MARDARGRTTLSIFTIIGWTATILGLLAQGYLSDHVAIYALVAMVVTVAIASALKLSLARVVIGIALPCAAIALFIVREAGGRPQQMTMLGTAVGALIIALCGLFVMLRSLLR